MLDEADMRRLDTGFRVINLIWLLMLVLLLFVIVAMAWVMDEGGVFADDESGEVVDAVTYSLYAASAAALAAAYVTHRSIQNPNSLISRLSFYWFILGLIPFVMPTGRGALRSPILRYGSGVWSCASYCQAIAIFGLIIYSLDGSIVPLCSLVAISAVASVYCRPRKQ